MNFKNIRLSGMIFINMLLLTGFIVSIIVVAVSQEYYAFKSLSDGHMFYIAPLSLNFKFFYFFLIGLIIIFKNHQKTIFLFLILAIIIFRTTLQLAVF